MTKKNILLINPLENDFYRGKEAYPSGALILLGTMLQEKGHRIKIIHTASDQIDNEKLKNIVLDFKPDIAGITMNTFQTVSAKKISNTIKKIDKNILTVTGGPHPSALGLQILKDFPNIDVSVMGEGEHAFLEIADDMPHSEIKGICYNGIQNPPREVETNLDYIPLPDLGLIDLKKFSGSDPLFAHPSMFVMASRGCPFQCIFCNKSIYGHSVRFRKPELVVREIEYLHKKYNVREIFFQDDTFNLNRSWAEQVLGLIIDKKLNKKLAFKVSFRANKNLVDKELLTLAKKAGVKLIFYGVESGNQEMLDKMKKGLTTEEIKRAFKLTHEARIKTLGAFIIGLPGETKETVKDTVKLWEEIHPYVTGCGMAIPLPNTVFDNIVTEKGHKLESNYDNYSFGKIVVRTDTLTSDDLNKMFIYFRRKIIKKFLIDLIKLRYLNELLLAIKKSWYIPYLFNRIKDYAGIK